MHIYWNGPEINEHFFVTLFAWIWLVVLCFSIYGAVKKK